MPCAGLHFRREKVTSTPKQHAWFLACEIAMRKSVKCSVENFRHSKKLTGGPEGGLELD